MMYGYCTLAFHLLAALPGRAPAGFEGLGFHAQRREQAFPSSSPWMLEECAILKVVQGHSIFKPSSAFCDT